VKAFLLSILLCASAQAQNFPTKPVRLVVPFPPGGGADALARLMAPKLGERWKQQVLIDNRPGASGHIGADAVAQSAPDGYTMLLTDRGALGINPSLYRNLPYDPTRDFAYIGIVTVAPYVLVIDPRLPAKSLAELVALAKARPGAINYASFGIASMAHLNLEALKSRLGIDLVHVPYKGAGPAVQGVIAGDAGVTIGSPAAVLGFVRDARLRAIAIGDKRRSPLLPEVPTLTEAGTDEDLLASTYFAFALPAATPRSAVERLAAEMKAALATPELARRLSAAGLEPAGSSGEELAALVRRDIPRFRRIIETVGIQPE